MKLFRSSFVAVALLCISTSLFAQTRVYVATNGDDSRTSTQAQNQATPWKTPQHAADAAPLGAAPTEVHVAQGDYSAGTTGSPVSCQGNNAALCISRSGTSTSARFRFICDAQWSVPSAAGSGCRIRSSAAGTLIGVIANNVDVIGFDAGSNPNAVIGILNGCYPANASCPTGNNVGIISNYVHDIAQTGNDGGPGGTGCPSEGAILINQHHGSNQTGITVIGNRVTNYGDQSLQGSKNQCHGIYVDAANAIVWNNIVLDIVAYGIHYYSAPCGAQISGNTVGRVGQSDIIIAGGDICSNPGTSTLSNNITFNALHYGIQLGTGGGTAPCTASTPILVANNLGVGNGLGNVGQANSCTTVTGGVTEAVTSTFAGYLGTSNDNLHLKAASIAVAGGTSSCVTGQSSCIPTIDLDGVARPSSGAQSIGAYVLVSGSSPAASFSPSPINFGASPVSTPASNVTATLRNVGTASLTFSNPASISGTNGGDFSIKSTTCVSPLPAGSSCTYILGFTPQAAGSRAANLTLTDNAAGSPHQLPLSGTGGSPAVNLNPTSINFNNVPVGTTSTILTTTFTNSGSTALTLSSVTITGTNAADFSFGGTGTCSQPSTINPGASCVISAKVIPSIAGSESAALSIVDDAGTQTVPMTVNGGTPSVSLTPTTFDFGSIQVGTASTAHTFTLSNPGSAPLTFTITTSSGVFVQSNTCTSPLAAAASCNIAVTFQPSTSGPQSGLLTVTSNAASSPNNSTLTGTGVTPAGLTLSPTTINFANSLVNSFSPVTNITVSNPNSTPVTLTSISVTGTNAFDFNAGACSTSATAFTDNFNNGSLDLSKWQIDTGSAPGTIAGVNTGTFASGNVDLSQGMLGLKVTQSGASPVISTGAEVRSSNPFGLGNYFWRMRAASTATSPYATGPTASGQISSTFALNSSVSNPYTEIDAPEIEGQHPNTIEWTSWVSPTINTPVSTTLANPEAAFHVYRYDWGNSSIKFQIDGALVATNTTNIPTAAANPMINLWGTNSTAFGGLATVGTRWMFVSGFAFTPAGIATIPAGGTCTIPVIFAPSSTGTKAATVSIVDSATGSPHQATLGGLGTAATATLTPSLAFATQSINTTSPTQNLTLANTGNGPMWFTIALGGANPGDFIITTTSCVSPLAGGQSCLIPVQFKPTSASARTATVSVTDSASGSPHTSSLTGTGTGGAPAVCLSTASVNFGNQPINTSSGTSPINVTNCGAANLVISGVNSTTSGLDEFPDQGGTTGCTGTPNGATVPDWCWKHDAGTPGTAVGTSAIVTSPSIDGHSRQVVSTFTGAGGLRSSISFLAPNNLDSTSTAYSYDVQVRVDDLTHVNQLEFDMNQVLANGNTVIYGTQCNFTSSTWDYTVATNATTSAWVHSNIACTKVIWTAAVFHHLIVKFHRDAAGVVTYDSISFDGSTTPFNNAFGNSAFTIGWQPLGLNLINFQMNGDNTSNTITAYLDQLNVSTTNFTQTNNCATVAPGAICTINGMFSPTFVGTIASQFRILSNAASSPDHISLSGFGTQIGGTLSPTSIPFGNNTVGVPSASTQVTFLNTGNTSVTLAAPTITGSNPGDFSATSSCGTVAPNASCTIGVVFTAGGAGSRFGTLTQAVGSLSPTVSLSGTGIATAPLVSLSPSTIDFGNVTQSTTSALKTIQLQNTGTASLTISSIAATGTNAADFTVTSHCPGSVAAGGLCTVDVSCTPSTATAETGSVTITDNAGGSPQNIPLACKGTIVAAPRAQLSSTSLTFSSTQVGHPSGAQVVSITNLGNATLIFTSITVGGTNPGDFTLASGTNCTTVVAGSSCALNINFVPTAAGSRSAAITIVDNASDSPQSLSMTGTGFSGAPSILVPISTVDFGNLVVGGTSSAVVFAITNQGTATATVTITAGSDFIVSDTCNGSIPAAASCSITAQFSPTALCGQFDPNIPGVCLSNIHTGTLSITSNSANSPQTVALKGTALVQTPPPGPVIVGMGGRAGTGGATQLGVRAGPN